MKEKMLMTQALDERDLLVKKINSKIDKIKLVDVKKKNEEKTLDSRVTAEEFSKEAESAFQQITDLIDRYQRLDAAIVASNAETTIETSCGTYTIAGAISLRNRLKGEGIYGGNGAFETKIANRLEMQYAAAVQKAETKNRMLDEQAENMRMSILGRDNKTKETKPLEVVEAYVKENTTEVIDPLKAEKKLQEMKEKQEALLNELNTKIKVSNATTMIEF